MRNLIFIFFSIVLLQTQGNAQDITVLIPSNSKICLGSSFKIGYSSTTSFDTSNVLKVQLSNSIGNFAVFTIVGSLKTTNAIDSIQVTIPSNISASNGYRIRITSTSPSIAGSSIPVTIGTPPSAGAASFITTTTSVLCTGNTLALSCTGSSSESYLWTGPNGFTSNQRIPTPIPNADISYNGLYSVRVVWPGPGGCIGSASNVNINISSTTAPPTPIIYINNPVCTGDTLKLSTDSYPGVTYTWKNYTSVLSTNRSFFIPNVQNSTQTGYYLQTTQGSCKSELADTIIVIKQSPSVTDAAVNGNIDLACLNSAITLSTSDISASLYEWRGPNNFSATGRIVSIPSGSEDNEGIYSVRATVNGCVSKYFNTVYLGIESTNPVTTQTPDFDWGQVITSGKYGASYSDNITRDSKGNLYVTGDYSSAYLKLTSKDSLAPLGSTDAFLAKYDSTGKYAWGIRIVSTGNDYPAGITTDEKGYIYVTGIFSGSTCSFGNNTVNRIGTTMNLFIAKFDSSGNNLWVKQATASSFNIFNFNIPITFDKAGNFYITSGYTGTFAVGSISLTGPGSFVAKFDSLGNTKWVKKIFGGNTSTYGIALDNSANCYITGKSPSAYISLSKFDSSGTMSWSNTYTQLRPGGNINSFTSDEASKLVTANNGDIILTAAYYKIARTPGNTISTPDRYIVVMRVNPTGNVIWYKYINEYVGPWDRIDIGIDQMENIYVAGKTSGNFSCSNVIGGSCFIAQYTSSGQLNWVKPLPGNTPKIFVTAQGNLYLYCNIGNSADFGNGLVLQGANGVTANSAILKMGKTIHAFNYSPSSLCVGSTISIPFSTDRVYNPTNIFKLQLSDVNGSFATSTVIGSLSSTTSGTIQAFLPTVTFGTKYRMRIVSSDPEVIGTNNGMDISITGPTITTGPILSGPYCGNSTIKIPFTVSSNCPFNSGNIFKAQLSDKNGLFNYPIEIGIKTGVTSDTVTAVIPDSIPYGTNYKLRIISTFPAIIGSSISNSITIYGMPQINTLSTNYCEGSSLTLSTISIPGSIFNWEGPNNFTSTGSSTTINNLTSAQKGVYSLSVEVGSCLMKPSQIEIKVFQENQLDSTQWEWIKNLGTSSFYLKHPTEIRTDNKGHLYCYGYNYNSTDTLNGFVLRGGPYLFKADTSGTIIWAKTIASSSITTTSSLVTKSMILDDKSNIYINGYFSDNITIGSIQLKSVGAKDVYFCKLDSNGNAQWAYQLGGSETYTNYDSDNCGTMEFDKAGNIILAGYYLTGYTGASFSGSNGITKVTHTQNIYASFITIYSRDGELLRYKTFENATASFISLDEYDNIYSLGSFTGSIVIDNIKLAGSAYPSSGNPDVFLCKFNSTLSLQWATMLGGLESETPKGLITDKKGSIYVAMVSSEYNNNYNPCYFPSFNNSLGFPSSSYLSKFDYTGKLNWVRPATYNDINHLVTDIKGHVYFSYSNSGSATIGCNTQNSPNFYPGSFIVKLDPQGNVGFIKKCYSTTQYGIVIPSFDVSINGDIFAIGEYNGNSIFDQHILYQSYGNFIGKIGVLDTIPFAYFTFSNNNCKNDTISFFDFSSSNSSQITSWKWDFNDTSSGVNNISFDQYPKHIFSDSGDYKVKLVVENSAGKKDSIERDITIYLQPEIILSSSQTEICSGSSITFNASASNLPTQEISWILNYGDNSLNETNFSSVHYFNNAGTYQVKVKGSYEGCSDSSSYTILVNELPKALYSIPDFCSGEKIIFSDTSTGIIENRTWKIFNDTTNLVFTNQYFSTSLVSGVYNLELSVIDINGCKDSIVGTIEILQSPEKPIITYSSDSLITTSSYQSYSWFIDGSLYEVTSLNKVKPGETGNYTVEVADTHGCKSLSDPYIYSISTSNINKIELNGNTVFPNPFTNFINLKVPNSENYVIKLVNSLGVTVVEQSLKDSNNNEFIIQTSNLNAGSYELIVIKDDNIACIKLVKQ